MSNKDAYIIFEADQVLTNDHLNEMFDYLDTQERLTRNKLIGIGIVCGVEVDNQNTAITISKGCGVTSKGYLVVWEDTMLTQYIPYALPANPLYSPFVNAATKKQYNLWRLLSDDDAKKIDGSKQPITNPAGFIKDKIVVLFLEATETDLKNCDTQDCNEKGRQMKLTAIPLLVERADMEAIIIKQKKLSGEDGLSNSYIERLGLKEISFQRFDVKATTLVTAFDIYDAYLTCIDDQALKNIAEGYSQCYAVFQPILNDYNNSNPFAKLEADLKTRLETVKKTMPYYIQYYYDFLDDLIKAYDEFKERSFDVITDCCPDEDLFPMHLMLGEAAADSINNIHSPYRQYFISSPLFNNQTALLTEVKLLFDRMVNLAKNFFIPQVGLRQGVPIRITPSRWGNTALSQRAIPYYYNIANVFRSWNPQKTKKGRAASNLSYNADKYVPAAADTVLNPMQYSIEPFDFYRIEGHIGQEFSSVLNVIQAARNSNRLPFDIIAIKAGTEAGNTTIKYDCHFEDLESQFKLIRATLACKMHEPLCIAAKVPSLIRLGTVAGNTPFSFLDTFSSVHTLALQDVVAKRNLILTSFVQAVRFTRKGDFIKTYCPVTPVTLGNEYLLSANKFFPRPAQIDLSNTSGAKAALMHLIDITEALMQTITGAATIYNFNSATFNRIYDDMISYFTDFMQAVLTADGQERKLNPMLYGMLEAVVTCCIDDQLKALMDEYTRRVQKIQQQNLLSQYLINNPGIDHKAGVPAGGTFIIVYHEAPPDKSPLTASVKALTSVAAADTTKPVTITSGTKKLTDTAAISKSNLTELLKLFDASEVQLSPAQTTALKDLAIQKFATAAARPPFSIPDKAVIADFYVPYLCCSDCAPVTYVFQKQQQTFSIDPVVFCSNDQKVYAIKAEPAIENISDIENKNSLKLEKDAAGNVTFIPANQAIQQTTDYTLVYKGVSIALKIVAIFTIDFKAEPLPTSPLSRKFVAGNIDNRKVEWNFGDGSPLSAEPSPVHTYAVTSAEQTYVVTLTVTDGPCKVSTEQTILITRPQQPEGVFTLEPLIFCNRDRTKKVFKTQPAPSGTDAIKNPDNLQMEQDADDSVFFIAAKQDIGTTKIYNLTYQGISLTMQIIVPDAGFTMKFERNTSPVAVFPTILTLMAKQEKADGFNWKLTTVTGAAFDFDTREVVINLSQLGVRDATQLNILLTVNFKNQTGVDCTDSKDYVVTPEILKNHLNKGEFDNLTSS